MSAIRLQRDRVHRATDAVLADAELPRRIRRAPLPWLLGAGIAGVVAGRLVLPPLVRAGRRQLPRSLRLAVHERVRGALTAAAVTALGRVASGRNGRADATPGETARPASNSGPESSDPLLSTQPRTS